MSATKIEYPQIESLVTKQDLQGEMMSCEFTCPKTKKAVASAVNVTQANRDCVASNIKATVQRGLVQTLMRSIARTAMSVFGNGQVGRMAQQVANEASRGVASKRIYSDKEKQRAVVAAFEKVAQQFVWNDDDEIWVHAEHAKQEAEAAAKASAGAQGEAAA